MTGKLVVPLLAVAIQSAVAEDLDILTTPNPEGDGLLEVIVEVVGLPVVDIVGELSVSDHLSGPSFESCLP